MNQRARRAHRCLYDSHFLFVYPFFFFIQTDETRRRLIFQSVGFSPGLIWRNCHTPLYDCPRTFCVCHSRFYPFISVFLISSSDPQAENTAGITTTTTTDSSLLLVSVVLLWQIRHRNDGAKGGRLIKINGTSQLWDLFYSPFWICPFMYVSVFVYV